MERGESGVKKHGSERFEIFFSGKKDFESLHENFS